MNIKAATILLIMLNCTAGLAAENQVEQAKQQTTKSTLGEKPGSDYVQLIREWADVTNFAKNAAEMSVERITHDLKKDPKYQTLITSDLMAELKQFFYEVYSSPESMVNLSKVYSQYFTIDDMVEMIKFYNTPLGQKMINANSALVMKNRELGSELLKKHEQGYMSIVKKYIKQPITEPPKK